MGAETEKGGGTIRHGPARRPGVKHPPPLATIYMEKKVRLDTEWLWAQIVHEAGARAIIVAFGKKWGLSPKELRQWTPRELKNIFLKKAPAPWATRNTMKFVWCTHAADRQFRWNR